MDIAKFFTTEMHISILLSVLLKGREFFQERLRSQNTVIVSYISITIITEKSITLQCIPCWNHACYPSTMEKWLLELET